MFRPSFGRCLSSYLSESPFDEPDMDTNPTPTDIDESVANTPRQLAPARLAESAFSMFLRDAFVYGTLFFTSIFIARTLGPSQMGLWSILLLLPSYASALGRPMTDVASVYFIARKELTVSAAASALLTISVVTWLLVLVVFLLAQGWLFNSPLRHFQDQQWLVLVMLSSALLSFLAMNYMYLMLAVEDVRGYNRHTIIRSTLAPLSGVLMLWIVGPDFEYLAWGVIIGNTVALLYGIVRVHRSQPYRFSFDTRVIRQLISFGAKLYAGSVIGFMGVYLAGGIIASYLNQESVAFFQIALTRALLLAKLASAIGTLLYPRIASLKDDIPGAIALFSTAFRVNSLLTGIAAITMMVLADPVIKLLYGNDYTPVIFPFVILTAGVAIDSMTGSVTSLFNARGRPFIPTILAAIVIVPQIILLTIFVPNGDILIAAWITSGAFVLGASFRLIAISRIFDINPAELLIPGKADIILIVRSLSRIVRRG
jgi:O-antigen/teichoic acid export membrane protein